MSEAIRLLLAYGVLALCAGFVGGAAIGVVVKLLRGLGRDFSGE